MIEHSNAWTGATTAARVRILGAWVGWTALAASLGQAASVTATRLVSNRLVLVSDDAIWMSALANLVVFGLAATLGAAAAARLRPEHSLRLILTTLLFLLAIGPLLQVPGLHPAARLVLALGVAVQGARFIAGRFNAVHDVIRRSLVILITGAFLWSAAAPLRRVIDARRQADLLPDAPPAAQNVVLVVLDTVRASGLSLYGYTRPTSPNLDRLGREGVVFDRAVAASPWTLPSHAALFTGQPAQRLTADWLRPLDGTFGTLAEAFGNQGYATAGFTANVLYSGAETGLARGFQTYEDYPVSVGMLARESWVARPIAVSLRRLVGVRDPLVVKRAARVNRDVFDWLDSRPARPFFLFINYFDAHAPYRPPPPFDTRFGAGGPQPDPMVRRQWSTEEIQQSRDAYDGAVAYVDWALGQLLERLSVLGLANQTVIAVTSDHGEQFGEHGLFDHGNSLYRQALHVPLVLRHPRTLPAGTRVPEPVSLIDVGATLFRLATGAPHAKPFPGRSLDELWTAQGARPAAPPPLSEVRRGISLPAWLPASKGTMQAVVLDGFHFIRNGDGVEELYDFDRDPGETRNLAARPELQDVVAAARRAVAGATGSRR